MRSYDNLEEDDTRGSGICFDRCDVYATTKIKAYKCT